MKTLLTLASTLVLAVLMLGLTQPSNAPDSKPATLDSLAFLKGTWSGTMGSDWVEESWSAPHGDSIIGMFRWQTGGSKTTMWELLSIRDEAGKPVLRLRHFDTVFDPWKSELGPVEPMPAAELSATRALFVAEKGGLKSVEYKCPVPDTLEITVRFRDESRPALEFDLKRN